MTTTAAATPSLTLDQQVSLLAGKRIYFGHQSVGANILDGIQDVAARTERSSLRIVKSAAPASVVGPGFFESPVGQNGDPDSKNEGFARVLAEGFGFHGGVAFYKYCYMDISGHTNVRQMFVKYRQNIDSLKATYPSLKVVHVTVPLTTVEPAVKAWVKSALGRETARSANARRNEFNELLRQSYQGDPVFDLAEIESTHADGSRSFFTAGNQPIYTLCPEYTTDGGHLNLLGRRRAAEKLIALLAQL